MLLAIDTSTRSISLAIHDGRQVLAETTWLTPDYHTVALAPRVADLLQVAGVASAAGLRAVAVALGPGTFTGLRAGIALAKGLALAGPVPLLGVPSLDITAAAQPRPPAPEEARLVAVLAAGRGRLFAAVYRWQPGRAGGRGEAEPALGERWALTDAPRIVTWDTLLETVSGDSLIFCGEIDAAGATALRRLGRRARLVPGGQALRRAGYLAELAGERLARGEADDPATLVPLYLHEPGSGAARPAASSSAP
jgi:tRNA threonylcarbamoyladenosine biosynthesis protein TsaB